MAKEELKIGEISKPRFEFRSFGRCFCQAEQRMARLSVPVPEKEWERHSTETYIVSHNGKILSNPYLILRGNILWLKLLIVFNSFITSEEIYGVAYDNQKENTDYPKNNL